MKHRHRASSAADALLRWRIAWAALVFGLLLMAQHGAAASDLGPVSKSVFAREASGPVIEFREGDYALSNSTAPPASGWTPHPAPRIYRLIETKWRLGDPHTLWARFRFDRTALGNGPLTLYTVSTRNQFVVFLNGAEVFRNYANDADQKNAWYRPYIVHLPQAELRPGVNEIMVRAFSQESVGVGRVIVGQRAEIENFYNKQYFWRITAPMIASSLMLMLGIFALLMWLQRREEVELAYLAISTVVYFIRNLNYFAEDVPFNLALFSGLSVAATLISMVMTFSFYIAFLRAPHFQRIVAILVALVFPYTFIHWYFGLDNMMLYIPTIILVFVAIILGVHDIARKASAAKVAWLAVMVLMLVFGIHDARLAGTGHIWKGNDFYLAVFNGFFFLLAFLLTFGLRAVSAFSALGEANATLERRVEETRVELAMSEEARQRLIVGRAIADERERLMQEMHDGIGSSLITALAVARQQRHPEATIKTLSRAISDLKITVDSLEPIEGDLVALLGNLRHRMASDLGEAGITCRWEVEPCGPLPWLDATNALHVLRIFQEAIGNVLAHSGACELRIGCREASLNGVPGIAAFVADNGRGFDASLLNIAGKGLSNMRARAASLHGNLSCETSCAAGTMLTLWLPYAR